jgi:hypothetical protein
MRYSNNNESTTASYSKSAIGMIDSTGIQMSNPFDNNTSVVNHFPVIIQPQWTIGEKQNEKHSFSFDWAGGLSELKGTINSVELAHEALKWR